MINQICRKNKHIWPACDDKTNTGWESTYWVWDVADSVHPDVPRNGKRVDPVQWDFVLVFQQVGAIHCHLRAETRVFNCTGSAMPSPMAARVHWPWRRLRAPGWWSRRGRRICRAAGGAFPLCPSSPAAGSYIPHRASLWSEGWSGGRRQSGAWCCSRSTGRSGTCGEGARRGWITSGGAVLPGSIFERHTVL